MRALDTFKIIVSNEYPNIIEYGTYKAIDQRGFIVGRFGIHLLYGNRYRLSHLPTGTWFFDISGFRRAVGLAAIISELPDLKAVVTKRGIRRQNKKEYGATVRLWKQVMSEYGFETTGRES